MDNFSGIQIYSYEGRPLSNPKFASLRTEFLDAQSISLSNDMLAIIDRNERKSKVVIIIDVNNGKPIGDPIVHNMEIMEVALNQYGSSLDRKLVFVDRNRDLYITPVKRPEFFKLATMVDSVKWNDQTDMLVSMADGKFVVWYYPSIVYVDRDLLPYVKFVKEESELGKKSNIIDFYGTRCNIRRLNGAISTIAVSSYPLMLYELVEKKVWDAAIRLCRYVKDNSLWACLAAMAIRSGELNTAEVSFAALQEVDKLQYIIKIKKIPTVEGRNAELALYMRRPDEAESILLQAGLIYRAIKMHIRLYFWNRALELATRFKAHVDTVLYYRRKYLEVFEKTESNPNFLQFQMVQVDWNMVREKIQQDKQAEAQRAKPYA